MIQYKNDNEELYNGRYVDVDDRRYISPSEAKLLELGYHKVEIEPTVVDVYEPTIEERLAKLKQQLQDINDAINQLENEQKEVQQ